MSRNFNIDILNSISMNSTNKFFKNGYYVRKISNSLCYNIEYGDQCDKGKNFGNIEYYILEDDDKFKYVVDRFGNRLNDNRYIQLSLPQDEFFTFLNENKEPGILMTNGKEIIFPLSLCDSVIHSGLPNILISKKYLEINDEGNYYYGLIDINGNEILMPKYHRIYPCRDGIFRVERQVRGSDMSDKFGRNPVDFNGYIDKNGNEIFIRPNINCEDFNYGFGFISEEIDSGYYIDKNGKDVFSKKFKCGNNFNEYGLASVTYISPPTIEDRQGLINFKGEEIFDCGDGYSNIKWIDFGNYICYSSEFINMKELFFIFPYYAFLSLVLDVEEMIDEYKDELLKNGFSDTMENVIRYLLKNDFIKEINGKKQISNIKFRTSDVCFNLTEEEKNEIINDIIGVSKFLTCQANEINNYYEYEIIINDGLKYEK